MNPQIFTFKVSQNALSTVHRDRWHVRDDGQCCNVK